MTNKPMLSERDKFEVFWRATMNVEAMDLHRCEFTMTAYEDQPYACHETERGRLTWLARALLDKPAAQHQGEPVSYTTAGMLEIAKRLPLTGRIGAKATKDERWNIPLFLGQAEQLAPAALTVWYGSMPESNGKTNWTAILHRKGEAIWSGAVITIDRSEYPDRVRYEADRMRYLIGELTEEPDILDYDDKLHSGYVNPHKPAPVAVVMPDDWEDQLFAEMSRRFDLRKQIDDDHMVYDDTQIGVEFARDWIKAKLSGVKP